MDDSKISEFSQKDTLLDLTNIRRQYIKSKYGEAVSTDALISVLKDLNKRFNNGNKIRDADRSLFFSGLMIALKNVNFRSTYKNIQSPSKQEVARTQAKVLESHNLNKAILEAITTELDSKINNLSKEFSWKDKFSFIKNVDYSLEEYKKIICIIEEKIFYPFQNEEKQDILGRAYKIFLSRAGKVDNKNIILTPDHIKELMVKLARLSVDDVVLNTCTGSGGFLMESMETMIDLAQGDQEKILNIKEKQLIGFEIDSVLFALACSNMFLHGDGRTHYVNGKFIASNLCLVLRDKKNPDYPINMQFYNCYFESIRKQMVSDLSDVTSKLTIKKDMFGNYYIDYVPYSEQMKFVNDKLEKFMEIEEKYKKAKKPHLHRVRKYSII